MEKIGGELKHLGFARNMALNAVNGVSSLYDVAKQNSGPLKSTVGTIENALTTAANPVYEKFKGLPDNLLASLDKTVEEASKKFDLHAPPLAKMLVNTAQGVVNKGSQIAQQLIQEALLSGLCAAISVAVLMFKNFAISKLAAVWYCLNRFPPFHAVGEIVVPIVAYFSNIYNKFIAKMDSRGYHIFGYLPSVPVEDVAKAYKQIEAAAAKNQ